MSDDIVDNIQDNDDINADMSDGYIVAALLRYGTIYRSDNRHLFLKIEDRKNSIKEYIKSMGLYLVVKENDGYAYLRSLDDEEFERLKSQNSKLVRPPFIMNRVKLSFDVSFLLVMLRKKLIEHDQNQSGTKLIIKRSEVLDMMATYYKQDRESTQFIKKIDVALGKLDAMGFIKNARKETTRKKAQDEEYEVKRILISLLEAQKIADFNLLLEQYIDKASR